MNAAIIKTTGSTVGGSETSLWLGAAGLSLCGVVLTQYISIRSYSISNHQLHNLVMMNSYVPQQIIAMGMSGPPLMAFWASVLFVAGIVVFIAQTDFKHTRYKAFALLPIVGGGFVILISLIVGEFLGTRLYKEVSKSIIAVDEICV